MKKRIWAYGILTVFTVAVLGYVWHHPGVSILGYARIQPGMHATEIEKLLDGSGTGATWRWGIPGQIPNPGWGEMWHGTWGTITLLYDAEGRVVIKEWHSYEWRFEDFLVMVGLRERQVIRE
jgi:hypothetical protein